MIRDYLDAALKRARYPELEKGSYGAGGPWRVDASTSPARQEASPPAQGQGLSFGIGAPVLSRPGIDSLH